MLELNCCRFTWQVFEESPESYLSLSRGAVWGYFVHRFDITEPLGFVQDAQAVMVLFDKWLAVLELWSVRVLDEPTAGRRLYVMTAWW